MKIILIKTILSTLLILCLLDWEYGFYELVRFVGMVGFSLLAYEQYNKNQIWFIIWLVSAILINPLFKVALGRTIWNIVDVIWVVLLVYSIYHNKKIQSS